MQSGGRKNNSLFVITFLLLGQTFGSLRRQFRHRNTQVVHYPLKIHNSTMPKENKHTVLETRRRNPTNVPGSELGSSASGVHMACKEIRSKRYLSDGFCASTKPVTEVVCAGQCLPIKQLPWYEDFMKVWLRSKAFEEWRCVEDVKRRQRVKLTCADGSTRTYKIKVVKSCKCKKYNKRRHFMSKTRPKRHHAAANVDDWDFYDDEMDE